MTGGILIFETPGTLTFNSNIVKKRDTVAAMFGVLFFPVEAPIIIPLRVFSVMKAKKVKELDNILIVGQECGKGKLANGVGVDEENTGAGGGGNEGGRGGDGGYEWSGCGGPNPVVYSIGVVFPAEHLSTKLFMGAGGGGPQADNAFQVYNGGNGGAIVFISANEIIGNGFAIKNAGGINATNK